MGKPRHAACEMATAIKRGIREACSDARAADALCAGVNALFEELTKDDAPVFRCALGAWEKR